MNESEVTIELTLDEPMPTHAILLTAADTDHIRVTVSANVEPHVLALLRPDLGLAVADGIDNRPQREEGR